MTLSREEFESAIRHAQEQGCTLGNNLCARDLYVVFSRKTFRPHYHDSGEIKVVCAAHRNRTRDSSPSYFLLKTVSADYDEYLVHSVHDS